MKKTDIIPLFILSFNKAKIAKTINVLHYLFEYLSLKIIIENKIMLIKKNYLSIKNMTHILYQKKADLINS